MAREIDLLARYIRTTREIDLGGPVLRQVLVNRINHEPTEAEIDRARRQVTDRAPV